jgi:hypothetical protein
LRRQLQQHCLLSAWAAPSHKERGPSSSLAQPLARTQAQETDKRERDLIYAFHDPAFRLGEVGSRPCPRTEDCWNLSLCTAKSSRYYAGTSSGFPTFRIRTDERRSCGEPRRSSSLFSRRRSVLKQSKWLITVVGAALAVWLTTSAVEAARHHRHHGVAPGHERSPGTPAKRFAPGHERSPGTPARRFAPGRGG